MKTLDMEFKFLKSHNDEDTENKMVRMTKLNYTDEFYAREFADLLMESMLTKFSKSEDSNDEPAKEVSETPSDSNNPLAKMGNYTFAKYDETEEECKKFFGSIKMIIILIKQAKKTNEALSLFRKFSSKVIQVMKEDGSFGDLTDKEYQLLPMTEKDYLIGAYISFFIQLSSFQRR